MSKNMLLSQPGIRLSCLFKITWFFCFLISGQKIQENTAIGPNPDTDYDYNNLVEKFDADSDFNTLISMINENKTKLETMPQMMNKKTNQTVPVKVKVRLDVDTLTRLSEKDMELTITFTIYQIWRDIRLTRKSDKVLVIPNGLASKIWKPDITIQSAIRTFLLKSTAETDLLRIHPHGKMHYLIKLTAVVNCVMEFHNFPLDRQTCRLILFSLGHYENEVKLDWQSQKNLIALHSVDTLSSFKFYRHRRHVDTVPFCFNYTDGEMENRMPNEFGIKKSFGIQPYPINSSRPLMPDCYNKNFLVQEFEFRRYFISVFFISYLPAIVMVTMGGLSTYIDPKSSPARVGMGITSILTVSTLIQGLKSSLPNVNYLTGLDIYLWSCFLFVGFCLVEYAYINYTTIVRPHEKQNRQNYKCHLVHKIGDEFKIHDGQGQAKLLNRIMSGLSMQSSVRPRSNVEVQRVTMKSESSPNETLETGLPVSSDQLQSSVDFERADKSDYFLAISGYPTSCDRIYENPYVTKSRIETTFVADLDSFSSLASARIEETSSVSSSLTSQDLKTPPTISQSINPQASPIRYIPEDHPARVNNPVRGSIMNRNSIIKTISGLLKRHKVTMPSTNNCTALETNIDQYNYSTGLKIDRYFRFWYTLTFIIFNIIYWLHYGYLVHLDTVVSDQMYQK